MYKYLFIVRHGSSPMGHTNISDFDRTLDVYGINDNAKLAKRFADKNDLPELLMSSSAIRALHSAIIFAQTFKYPINNITVKDEIYLANKKIMLDLIKQTNDNFKSLMIFGHNPTFTNLANHFLKDKIYNMPTSSIVALKFELDSWSSINHAKCIESFFDHP